MKNRKAFVAGIIIVFIFFMLLGIRLFHAGKDPLKDGEMLQIVTTVHNNGKNDDDGVSMQLYAYYILNSEAN